MSGALILVLALLLDSLVGEPEWLWKRVPHPAVLMGKAIEWLDQTFNKGDNPMASGALGVLAFCVIAAMIGWAIEDVSFGGVLEVIVVAVLLAQKSLTQHVQAVADALRQSVEQGRDAVSQIVGRDTAEMDGPAVSRSAIESAAENFSDGVVAPAFWFLIAGLPGILVYKLVNTADSMIGYRTARHEAFGKFAARLDDAMNWVPARMTAVLFMVSRWQWQAWGVIRRDAPLHRSPNAGWPEAAMAATLGVALSGPRSYEGEMRDFPWVNAEGVRDIGPKEIDQSVDLLWSGWLVMLGFVILVAVVT
ncbi:adenosylcobinamide-phosphate synthase [Aliiroseovarius sediminilitoris]|uniref:Cobalamin biosynthesis protein CobD n=1 Tax=Aliiroseovarius sediminilitoris TaxID=1173584 RepID=A0A1I0MJ60_9RHOB|nr:adenosylcobinamide-phosphate synthase CbiB [Aliiroseovarius sediminilitoris]SEV88407.1 adenosylcobinamide-phosphate synthase [Aliiroseovarius sediminilitoris]